MFFKEVNEIDLGETTIANIFIDIFMPMANGLYVKVYLLGYRQACDPNSNPKFDNNSIAKNLNIPLSDVIDAWKFWQNKNAAGVSAAYLSATESDGPLKRDPKGRNQTALSTLLERRHLVQAYTWQGVPLTTALTRLTLGFQARLERLWEWETLIPKVTPLPQKSHFAIHCTSHPDNSLNSCVSFERLDIIAKIEEKSKSFFHFFLFIFRLIFFCTLV